jgi:aryl-alcohol dehydrogenase-like predicted oxidoreductase
MAQGSHVIPIAGTTHPRHLKDNLRAATVQLAPRDLTELDSAPAAAEETV